MDETLIENQSMIYLQKFFISWLKTLNKWVPALKEWLTQYTLIGKYVGNINYDEEVKPKDFTFLYLIKKDMNKILEKNFVQVNKTFGQQFGIKFIKFQKTKFYF